jgi:hypothetical protein
VQRVFGYVVIICVAFVALAGSGRLSAETSTNNIRIMVLGDGPYEQKNFKTIEEDLLSSTGEVDFVVHVGDLYKGACSERKLLGTSELFRKSKAPVIFALGDNEYSDCLVPDRHLSLWRKHLLDFHQNWNTDLDIAHQDQWPENSVFIKSGVMFVFLSLFNGKKLDLQMRKARNDANFAWLSNNIDKYRGSYRAIAIFSHIGLRRRALVDYVEAYSSLIRGANVPAFFFHGNEHIHIHTETYLDVPGFTRISVDRAGEYPGMQVQIELGPDITVDYDRRLSLQQFYRSSKRFFANRSAYWIWRARSAISDYSQCEFPSIYEKVKSKEAICPNPS